MTIYNYRIYEDHIDIIHPGSVCSIYNSEVVNDIKSWIKEAERWTPKDGAFKAHICTYIEYMYDEKYGEDHTYIYE